MEITTGLSEINKFLIDYKGHYARIWLFDISHTKLAIKIYSHEKEDIIYLVMSGCKYIKGSFSLSEPDLRVSQYFDNEILETKFKVNDQNSDFELVSTAGVALAKGLEEEFGSSFENFFNEN